MFSFAVYLYLIKEHCISPLDAFLTKPEQRLLGAVLLRPERDFGTLELLAISGSSRSAGSSIIKRLVEAGALIEKRVGNQRRLSANAGFLLYPELRRMVLKTLGLAEPLARVLQPIAGRIEQAFIFGSVASGKDTSESDIDLAVIGDVDLFTVSPLLDEVEKEIGRRVRVSLYSPKEWAEGRVAYESIKNGPRIQVHGGDPHRSSTS
jgi:predicted nucleotidyltransferase